MSQPSTQTASTTLRLTDANTRPAWGVYASVRGMDIPLLEPVLVQADEVGVAPRGLIRLPGRAWRWARRQWAQVVIGRTPVDELREGVAACVAPGFRSLIAELTPSEVMVIYCRYLGAQQAYQAAITHRAFEAALPGMLADGRSEGSGLAAARRESDRIKPAPRADGMVEVRPGDRLPGIFGGQRVGAPREGRV